MAENPNLWYVGVLLEIVSTMSGTIGKQLIRLSETTKKANPHCSKVAMIAGLVVNTLCGPFLDMAAYSFAPQSLIAPFGGLDVVWNAALAPFLLKEKLTARRAVGCALVVLGTVVAGFFGNHVDPKYTLDYFEDTFLSLRVLIYAIVFFAWFFFNQCVLMRRPKGSAVRGVSLGCTAGSIAGNMFCVKALMELIQRSISYQEGEIWLHWLPYVLLVGAIFFALSNVVYMTRGLLEFEALFMVTVYEGSMIVSGCISGAVVLLDLRGLQLWRVVAYSCGILVIVVGMYVIFSQEAMAKSSSMDGIESSPLPRLDAAQLKEQSLHGVYNPALDPKNWHHGDPTTMGPGSNAPKELGMKAVEELSASTDCVDSDRWDFSPSASRPSRAPSCFATSNPPKRCLWLTVAHMLPCSRG